LPVMLSVMMFSSVFDVVCCYCASATALARLPGRLDTNRDGPVVEERVEHRRRRFVFDDQVIGDKASMLTSTGFFVC